MNRRRFVVASVAVSALFSKLSVLNTEAAQADDQLSTYSGALSVVGEMLTWALEEQSTVSQGIEDMTLQSEEWTIDYLSPYAVGKAAKVAVSNLSPPPAWQESHDLLVRAIGLYILAGNEATIGILESDPEALAKSAEYHKRFSETIESARLVLPLSGDATEPSPAVEPPAASTPEPTAKPTVQKANPKEVESFGVYGPVIEDLKAGTTDTLSIVARGKYQQGTVAVVIRNNTNKTYRTVDVSGEVRDADGKVTQTVNGFQFYPSPIPPGGLVLGQIYFDQPVNEGDKVELKVKGSEISSYDAGAFPLELAEFNVLDDGRVTGSVRNSSDKTTTNRGYLILLCFDEGTTPVWSEIGSVDEGLAPGEIAAFEFGRYGASPLPCDRYLFSGYSDNE